MDEIKEIKVAKPEDWPVATEVRTAFVLDNLSASSLSFNLRAMSYGELRQLEEQLPIPEAPVIKMRGGIEERDIENLDYQEKLATTHFTRWITWIDKCWKPLPGANQNEKVKWAEENLWRNGEVTAIFNQLRKLSGLGTGQPVVSKAVVEIKEADPETWAKASQATRLAYKIPHENAVLVFELCGLSQLKVNQIREMCRPPAPSMRPEMHKITKKPIPGTEVPDYSEPNYQQALKESTSYENCLLLEAALFPFPGGTKEEKLKWLSARPAFEVIALSNHLANNVISYRERVDFF